VLNLKKALLATALLSVGACAGPAISDIATDKVRVRVDAWADDPKAVHSEAERGCAIYNRVPVAISKWTSRRDDVIEYLFACQDPTHANVTPRT
jgi:hypothetical protein